MAISRKITKRLGASGVPVRTFSTRNGNKVGMDKISSPVELLSTTNVLSYDAPDLETAKRSWRYSRFERSLMAQAPPPMSMPSVARKHPLRDNSPPSASVPPALSPSHSPRTSSEEEHSSGPSTPTGSTTPSQSPRSTTHTPTLTDSSSGSPSSTSTSPSLEPELELNHLSCYFPDPGIAALKRSQSARFSRSKTSSVITANRDSASAAARPALPQRAASHSKSEHEKLARQRSVRASRDAPSPLSLSRAGSSASKRLTAKASCPSFRQSADNIHVKPATNPTAVETWAHIAVQQENAAAAAPPMTAPLPSQPSPSAIHPFTRELEQLHEVAEDFHEVVKTLRDDEAAYMKSLGLNKCGAEEYQALIGLMPGAWRGSQEWI